MPITPDQKRVALCIVNIFETGKAGGDYGAAEILPDGAGISYGRSQATDGGDNLDTIVQRYIDLGGKYAPSLLPFLDELHDDATTRVRRGHEPQWVIDLLGVLRTAGKEDPIMRTAQDQVFDVAYWNPAAAVAEAAGLVYPLSWAVLYDTAIHSGPGAIAKMRNLFPELPPARGGKEAAWTSAYVAARRAWLAGFTSSKGPSHSAIVRKTVYRMDAFRALIQTDQWELKAPLTVRGVTIP